MTQQYRFEENIAAALVELTESERNEMENGASQIKPSGDRYLEAAQKMTDR